MENKNLENKINNTYYIILITLALSFLICLCFIIIFVFKSHLVFNISGDDADKSILNLTITHFLSAISAVLVYIAFRQTAGSNVAQEDRFTTEVMINKADKDFDRNIKLIDDLDKFSKRIQSELTTLSPATTTIKTGNDAIVEYIIWLKTPVGNRLINELNREQIEKNLFVYLVNISFILTNTQRLKNKFNEYYINLNYILLLHVPHLRVQLKELILLEQQITNYQTTELGKDIYREVKKIKQILDSFTKVEPHKN